jgi:hypothetical protein
VATSVSVAADRIVIEHLELVDADLARLVEERDEAERPELVERALKIGLLALRDAGVTVNVDFVQKEMERLLVQVDERNRQASQALDSALRQEFAEDGGRLPRTLERFLGDQGTFRSLVAELFDPRSRESAIGRFDAVLGTYFDGDSSRLAQLLDPTREGSPLNRFHSEITKRLDTLAAEIKAQAEADRARRDERSKGTAKGADFEDVLEGILGGIAQGLGDVLERTGTVAGDEIRGKKGDFVLTVDPGRTGGHQLRVVIESKDRAVSVRGITEELAEARHNRSAQGAIVVFTPQHAPSSAYPLAIVGRDVWCVVDPETPDRLPLECAVRLARIFALDSLRTAPVQIRPEVIHRAVEGIGTQLSTIQGMKSRLTSISAASSAVAADLDGMRVGVLRGIAEVEAELGRVEDSENGDAGAASA